MAGLPLKSGADFYNLEAARMRLHNLGADPTEVGAGLIYFNTSTGLNTSQKARLYTGSAWKTIAFSEDLDVASNADFLALQRRVDLLSGDVDTDAIISNMKEVSAFLEGFAEDASLMDLLNGKLDKTGGTLSSPNTNVLTLNSTLKGNLLTSGTYLVLQYQGVKTAEFGHGWDLGTYMWAKGHTLRITNDGIAYVDSNSILTSAGGTISGTTTIETSSVYSFYLKNTNGDTCGMQLQNTKGNGLFIAGGDFGVALVNAQASYNAIGITDAGSPYFGTTTNKNTLIHSGNVGEYAMKYIGATTVAESELPALNTFGLWHTKGAYIRFGISEDYNITIRTSSNKLQALMNASKDADWKTIAFTDSDITGNAATASSLVTSTKLTFASSSGNNVVFGGNTAPQGYDMFLMARNLKVRMYSNSSSFVDAMNINSSGNVTIGASDLAGTSAKLYVDGHIKLGASGYLYKNDKTIIDFAGDAPLFGYGTAAAGLGTKVYGFDIRLYYGGTTNVGFILNNSGNVGIGTTAPQAKLDVNGGIRSNAFINLYEGNTTNKIDAFISGGIGRIYAYSDSTNNYLDLYLGRNGAGAIVVKGNGNVLIGTTTDNGAKLQVNGDLHVSGNIIADGEVSAGGAAEEGGNAGGGGAFHSESIGVGATQTTIAHGLGTDDIVVSIYEKDGVSGRWSIILTDVEIVDANNIIVSFGSATSVEHKVVIMGAVA